MDSHESVVDALSASLVREYLSRKGLKSTLHQMDTECPRSELSVSSRQTLMKQLHLERLMKKNKEETNPLRTMLEVMTKFHMEKQLHGKGNPTETKEPDKADCEGLGSALSFQPQTDQPAEVAGMRSMARPNTAALSARREKNHSELVVDENVQGESVMGDGKSGVISGSLLEGTSIIGSQKPMRPLSSKKRATGGPIRSTDDDLGQNRRNFMRPKSSKAAGDQLAKSAVRLDKDRATDDQSLYKTNNQGSDNQHNKPYKEQKPAPVSFEALLMKGEERASLLQKIGLERKENEDVDQSYKVESSSMITERENTRKKSVPGDSTAHHTPKSKPMDIELGDIDDIETDLGHVQLQPNKTIPSQPVKLTKVHSTPIDLKTAISLKNLVLGSPSLRYTDEWLFQALSFCDLPDIKYGIVQKRGGPCGVLAAVQACMLQEMLFGDERLSEIQYKNPSRFERSKFLARGLAKIFWRAGEQTRAVVVLPSDTTHLLNSSKFKQDEVTEKLSVYTFTNFDELAAFLTQSVSQYETDGCPGVILVMYAAILSRKQYHVKADFDSPETTLIASHGYCTQGLVNLLLTGRAVSNTFNDVIQLDSGGTGEPVILKGINSRSDIGLLSLFEHYKSCQVGTYLKTPKYPVWVICSESHFSVLFSPRRDLVNDWKVERRFDLIYYDGLSRQQEEIRLTISTINPSFRAPNADEELVPPLDNCIRTKWADAEINWNGYDPIL